MRLVKNILKLLLFLLIVVLVWYFGSVSFYKMTTDNKLSDITEENFEGQDLGEGNKIEALKKNELLFLLAGTDQNKGDSNGMTRTDTLMLFKINFSDGTVNQVSIPRDTRVIVEDYYTKINHASAYGKLPLTIKTIRDWLDIDLDYYIKVNFESVVALVDLVGGVEIDVPEVVANGIGLKPGLQKLDGKKALDFVRFRKGYATGDLGRVEAQQSFIHQVFSKMLTTKNILRSPILVDILYSQVDTNIPRSFMTSKLLSLRKFSSDKFTKEIIPGYGDYIDGVSYYIYDREETIDLRDRYFSDYRLNGLNYLESEKY
ncbi:MAG: LCP family protein [Tissierellia bacterium]|nr:LCP family protein [Tissierellia bacterium]